MIHLQANEVNILRAVNALPPVQATFECGLFENRTNPCWAVSPDAIAVVKGTDGRNRCWCIEAKTKTRNNTVCKAKSLAASLPANRTAWCRLGDNTFKQLVPDITHQRQVRVGVSCSLGGDSL